MSCTRLYVESTEILKGQGREKRLLSLPEEWFENMWGKNSLFSINTKETKLLLIGHFLDLRDTSQPFLRSYHHWSPPFPLVSPSYPDTHLPLYQQLQEHSSALLKGFHCWSPPQPTHLIPFKGYHNWSLLTQVSRRLYYSTSAFYSPWVMTIYFKL